MKPLLEELFRIGLPLIMLAGVLGLFRQMYRDHRRRRRALRVRRLELVGILAPSNGYVTTEQERLDFYAIKRGGLMTWRVLA